MISNISPFSNVFVACLTVFKWWWTLVPKYFLKLFSCETLYIINSQGKKQKIFMNLMISNLLVMNFNSKGVFVHISKPFHDSTHAFFVAIITRFYLIDICNIKKCILILTLSLTIQSYFFSVVLGGNFSEVFCLSFW